MKQAHKIILVSLLTVSLFLPKHADAQAPEKMTYQSVIRDASNDLLTSQTIGMQISILQGSAAGAAVYVETHSPSTDANGLVSIEIGAGTIVSGNFTTIDWENGPYFVKTETDPTGATSYTLTGISQLLSIPYALYAKSSGSSLPGLPGIQGVQGIQGPQGPQGIPGTNGVGITPAQASAIIANTAKKGQADGTQVGQMQYWNGSQWTIVNIGTEGQMLMFVGGVPTWTTVDGLVY